MKKSNFVTLILGTIGIVFFALGMCMTLIPEWEMFNQGIICGVVGLVILLLTLLVRRKMEGKNFVRPGAKAVGTAAAALLGALLLGVGMCLTMVFDHLMSGIAVGIAGIVVLLMLIPLTKGIRA